MNKRGIIKKLSLLLVLTLCLTCIPITPSNISAEEVTEPVAEMPDSVTVEVVDREGNFVQGVVFKVDENNLSYNYGYDTETSEPNSYILDISSYTEAIEITVSKDGEDFTKSFTCDTTTTDTVIVDFYGMPDTINVVVKDFDGVFVQGVTFKVGETLLVPEYVYPEETSEEDKTSGAVKPTHYELNIDNYEEAMDILVFHDDVNFHKKFTCNEYTVTEEVDFYDSIFTIPEDGSVTEDDSIDNSYDVNADYDSDNTTIELDFNTNVKLEIIDNNDENFVEVNEESVTSGVIDYTTPGTVEIKATKEEPTEGYDFYSNDAAVFNITINNPIAYELSENEDRGNVQLDANNVLRISKKYEWYNMWGATFTADLTSEYSESVTYAITSYGENLDEDDFWIDEDNGEVGYDTSGTVTITATCGITGSTASYILNIANGETSVKGVLSENLTNSDAGNVDKIEADNNEITVALLDYLDCSDEDKIVLSGYTKLDVDDNNFDGSQVTYTYTSSDDTVASINSATGVITVNGAGATNITVSATMDNYIISSFVFELKVESATLDRIYVIYEETVTTQISIDEADLSSETELELPISFIAYNSKDEEIEGLTYTLSCNGLTFDGYTITNLEDLERNKIYTIKVVTAGNTDYSGADTSFTFVLNGEEIDNSAIIKIQYKEEEELYNLVTGKDGRKWAYTGDIVVSVVDETLYTLFDGIDYVTSLNFDINEPQDSDKQHLYAIVSGEYHTLREYFGVDFTAPVISGLYGEDNILPINTPHGMYATDDITFTVEFKDEDEHLYSAALYNGTAIYGEEVSIVKNEAGDCTVTFTITANDFMNETCEFAVYVYDAAGRSNSIALNELFNMSAGVNELTFDGGIPDAEVSTVTMPEGTVKYPNGDDTYYSKNVDISIKAYDLNEDYSGIKEVVVFGNGQELERVPYSDKTLSDIIVINTGAITKNADGKVEISVYVVDNAGKSIEKTITTLYIDEIKPEAEFNNISTTGNITPSGNYYDSGVTLKLKLSDNSSSIKSIKALIGDKEYAGVINGDIATFAIPDDVRGDMSFVITDNVDNTGNIKLNELKQDGENVFTNNLFVIDKLPVDITLKEDRKPDYNNKWYNSKVDISVNIADEEVSAGIKDIVIYVNDVEYKKESYPNNTTYKNNYTVSIDNNWINSVINNDGSYTVKAVVTDNAGNENTDNMTVYIDTVAPVLGEITGVVKDSNNTGVVTLTVKLDEKHYNENGLKTVLNVTRELDGVITDTVDNSFKTVGNTTEQNFVFTEDGTYTITVESVDAAGNKAVSQSTSFILDNTAPFVSLKGITTDSYIQDSATLDVNVIESNFKDEQITISIIKELNGVTETIGAEEFDATVKDANKQYSFTEEGKYTVKVHAVDGAGNISDTSSIVFVVDTNTPEVSVDGVDDGINYTDGTTASLVVKDNYFNNYTLKLVKTGKYLNKETGEIKVITDKDVTEEYIGTLTSNNVEAVGTLNIGKFQENDGIYVLTLTGTDKSGKSMTVSKRFIVNGFGSIYVFDDTLTDLKNSYVTEITEDVTITEYNPNMLDEDSIKLTISRDGSPIENPEYSVKAVQSKISGDWYTYEYIIDKSNFDKDGMYSVYVSSKDEAGNWSESITYDLLDVKFTVDTTKPEISSITGLEKRTINASEVEVFYTLFDAASIKNVKIYVNGDLLNEVTEFPDGNTFEGSFIMTAGTNQKVRIVVEDLAGNITDTDNKDDKDLGAYPEFENNVVISTNFFVRWYSNKVWFYGTIGGAVVLVGILATVIILKKRGND